MYLESENRPFGYYIISFQCFNKKHLPFTLNIINLVKKKKEYFIDLFMHYSLSRLVTRIILSRIPLSCRSHEIISDLTPSSLPSSFKTISLPVTSPNSKMNLTSPKRGQKREEGWKEVVRR